MRLIRVYTVRIVFLLALLLGLQLPAVVDQYGQRVGAQYLEVEQGLEGFQQVADRFFAGDLQALIAHHERSSDPVFRAEAEPLRQLFSRSQRLAAEQQALDVPFPARLLHVLVAAERGVLSQTLHDYRPGIPLRVDAVATSVLFALLVSIILALLLRLPEVVAKRRAVRRTGGGPLCIDRQKPQ